MKRRLHGFIMAAISTGILLLAGSLLGQVVGTGGNATNDVGLYRIHVFTNVGTHTFSVTEGFDVEVLVVGGGGGGGNIIGGGGGAGGLIHSNAFTVMAGSNYTVTVGAGGAAQASGTSSVFGPLVAVGGGRGGTWQSTQGQNGGSGGGHAANNSPAATTGVEGQGHGGGTVGSNMDGGSGGGGAGTPGTNGISTAAGKGGAGREIDISGAPVWYAGGGGGGIRIGTAATPADGGQGGGGNGARSGAVAGNGAPNTGGGGGGGAFSSNTAGGSGGSGIVIVRYFNFRASDPLSVHTFPATEIGLTHATLNGIVGGFGDAEAPKIYLCWGTADGQDSSTSAWQRVAFMGDAWSPAQTIQHAVYDFNIGETNFYRLYATNSTGEAWSDAQEFTTIGFARVGIGAATVDYRAATLHGVIEAAGGDTPLAGFAWWPLGGATNHVTIGSIASGAFSTNLVGLTPGTDYAYAVWASNVAGTAWSATNAWQSWALMLPVVIQDGVTNVTRYTATLRGELTNAGDDDARVGFTWWTVGGATSEVTIGTQPEGTFSAILTDLTLDTPYEFAAWASNQIGRTWSSTDSFRTADLTPREYTWIGPLNGDWFTAANWNPVGIPGNGIDTVLVTGSSVLLTAPVSLAAFRMTGGTLTFSNWNTRIKATTVVISNATVTLPAAFSSSQMSNRVHFTATDFSLANGATINVNGRGFAAGHGQGAGGAGGYGGRGGLSGGLPYGSTNAPVDPGSGGSGGAGGGLVWLETTGQARIDGSITANGSNGGASSGGGSGGGIRIQADTVTGSGSLSATGGAGGGSYGNFGGGGGGRIALVFNAASQAAVNPRPTLTYTVLGGNDGSGKTSVNGTLFVTHPVVFAPTVTVTAFLWSDASSWTANALTFRQGDLVLPKGFGLTVTGDLTVTNGVLRYHYGDGTPASLVIGGSLALTHGAALHLHAGATNGAAAAEGGLLQLAGILSIPANCTLNLHSDPTDGGSIRIRAAVVNVANGGAVNATGLGYGSQRGSGRSTGSAGASFGGRGWSGADPYGYAFAPVQAGSGGSETAGGGLIWIEAPSIRVDGELRANGSNGVAGNVSGASGGGIVLVYRTLEGGGTLRANGGNGTSGYGSLNFGGGGGGRIAVLRVSDDRFARMRQGNASRVELIYGVPEEWTDRITVNGGFSQEPGRNGDAGSVVFAYEDPQGNVMLFL